MALPLLPILSVGMELIKRIIPDKEKQAEAQLELLRLEQAGELTEIAGRLEVVKAEASSEHWITATWRPLTMLIVVAIIANNYLLFPYLSLFFPGTVQILDLPPQLWTLFTVGVGGYVVGRSGEKMITNWKDK
jgi:hypothetical protein